MTRETLWDFAMACYQRDGVAQCCLHLQDTAGADVNMLLTAAWLAAQGRYWQPAEVRALIAVCTDWRQHCILPLRAVRRYLKEASGSHALYPQVKALELEAELQQLHLLYDALQAMPLNAAEVASTDVLAANLLSYFDCLDADHQALTPIDLHALIGALRR